MKSDNAPTSTLGPLSSIVYSKTYAHRTLFINTMFFVLWTKSGPTIPRVSFRSHPSEQTSRGGTSSECRGASVCGSPPVFAFGPNNFAGARFAKLFVYCRLRWHSILQGLFIITCVLCLVLRILLCSIGGVIGMLFRRAVANVFLQRRFCICCCILPRDIATGIENLSL